MPAPRQLLDIFPYEVFEKIVFSIPIYETRDLRNCALASKAFLVPAQQSIFFSVHLGRKASNLLDFVNILKRSPHLGTYVRGLDLNLHPTSTREAEHAAAVFRLMPSVRRLVLSKLGYGTPWDIMRSALEDVILPQLRYLSMWSVYDAPAWLVSSCRQLDELYLNDCSLGLDETPVVGVHQVDPIPLRYLHIADLGNELFDFLRRSVTQLVAFNLPLRDYMYGGFGDRSDISLTRLPELMNPMANTLVSLNIDAWPNLHMSMSSPRWFHFFTFILVDDRKMTEHPFFIGRYPRLRYFAIRLGFGPDFAEEHDELPVEDLETQIAWLSNMLCEVPSSSAHPLGYVCICLEKWWMPEHTKQPMDIAWRRLDLALAGDQSIAYPRLKELQFSPKNHTEHATDSIEIFFPLLQERGVLVVNKRLTLSLPVFNE
ncbi:hypothetical protein DL96DRAFT_146807 [Flagelloscypha sp. PMI_526]|nr:hypothetical protein DL96DRAFT_146807 [Flagelloscypha sp. PMI_526]